MNAEPPTRSRRQATVADFDMATGAGRVLLDDGVALPLPAEASSLGGARRLRRGQRVVVEVEDGGGTRPQVRLVHLLTVARRLDQGREATSTDPPGSQA